MPELPEVEITVRLLNEALRGAEVERAIATGISTLKSFDPRLSDLAGQSIEQVRRRGKHILIDFSSELTLLVHLMSAGRLQLFDKLGSHRDKTSRLLITLEGGRELRLREFGTHQRAWVKLIESGAVDLDESLATLGPEAWPNPPPFAELPLGQRPLHAALRDQQVIAGIGRSWVDEILHRAKLSPFKRGDSLTEDEASGLREGTVEVLGGAIAHYEKDVRLPIPDKFPMPLIVHRRQGLPCPRCETKLEAVHYEDHVMTYCPRCQTGGKLLKDRRLSRLLR